MQVARILVDGQSDLVLDYGIPPEEIGRAHV